MTSQGRNHISLSPFSTTSQWPLSAPKNAPIFRRCGMHCDVMPWKNQLESKSPLSVLIVPGLSFVMLEGTVVALETLAFLPELADDGFEVGMVLVC